MPNTTHRIAQTSTEAKRQHKKNGPGIPERQQKQLERAHELDQRAARLREAEKRRRAAKKKREEREEHQRLLRQQQGIGEATQAIGYNHTQARAKSWMESFLGVDKKKEEAKRKRGMDLTERLEEIAKEIEKEPWDDDEADDIALDLPDLNAPTGEKWVDDDLDDDSLLEAHNLVISDPLEEPSNDVRPALALDPSTEPTPLKQPPVNEDVAFVREHGYINRVLENVLDKLPGTLIELLSQDMSMRLPEWNPSVGLLHKLNPTTVPPHRLRIKVGCVVILLRDLNSSSQLSRSQYLRILRVENERLECLVLDGQLEGTKTFLTRVPFFAKYKNKDQHLFRRTQFPIRVATDYISPVLPRDTSKSGFKLPSIPGRVPPTSLVKKHTLLITKAKPTVNQNPSFKLPGLPASKSSSADLAKSIPTVRDIPPMLATALDGWDDFLESGTQIARELSAEVVPPLTKSSSAPVAPSPSMVDCLPPLSTQDLDFSLDDLDEDAPTPATQTLHSSKELYQLANRKSAPDSVEATVKLSHPETNRTNPTSKGVTGALSTMPTASSIVKKLMAKSHTPARSIDLSTLRASQKPPSVSDRPGLKRKTLTAPPTTASKRQCTPITRPSLPAKPAAVSTSSYNPSMDFVLSTQDVASFFDDDDDNLFGSPPIPV